MQLHRQFNRLFIGKVLLSGSNFIILFLLSNYFPAAFAGEYYFQVTFISTIAIFLSFGADNSLFYFIKKKILSLSSLLGLASGLLYIFLFFAGLVTALFYLGLIVSPASYIFTAAFIFSLLVQNIFNAGFSGKQQGWKLQAVNIIINIVFGVYVWVLIFNKTSLPATFLLYSFYGVNFVASIVVLLVLYFNHQPGGARPPSGKILLQLFKFGSLPYISNSIFFLGANIDLFFIRYYCDPKLTVYVQAVKIFQLVCSVTYLIYYPFMGKVLTVSYREGVEALLRTGRIVITALLLLMLPFYVVCYFFLDNIFPADTQTILRLLLILYVAVIATSTAYLYTSYFVAMKKYRQNIISAVIFLVTVTILCLVLIPQLGVYGGAIAYSAAILFSLVFDMLYIVRSVKVSFSEAVLLKRDDIKFIKSIF